MKYTAETLKAEYRGFLPDLNNKSEELRPLNDDECKHFINVCMIDPSRADTDIRNSIDKVPTVMILNNRLKHVEVEPDIKTKMFLGCIVRSPGVAVVWAFTLARLAFELKRNPTFDDLFMNVSYFGEGLPTEAKSRKAWESQKCDSSHMRSDNLVDWSELWPRWKEVK